MMIEQGIDVCSKEEKNIRALEDLSEVGIKCFSFVRGDIGQVSRCSMLFMCLSPGKPEGTCTSAAAGQPCHCIVEARVNSEGRGLVEVRGHTS